MFDEAREEILELQRVLSFKYFFVQRTVLFVCHAKQFIKESLTNPIYHSLPIPGSCWLIPTSPSM